MTDERYRFEPLGSHHDRKSFSCGVEPLDRYFYQQAGQDQRKRLATVFVLYDAVEPAVVGYYPLSATAIATAELPEAFTRRLTRYPHLPGILLGRLAVDARYRGQGFGKLLLMDALRRCHAALSHIAAVVVVVDAKDDNARLFYEQYGFQRFLDDERRLYLPLETARVV